MPKLRTQSKEQKVIRNMKAASDKEYNIKLKRIKKK